MAIGPVPNTPRPGDNWVRQQVQAKLRVARLERLRRRALVLRFSKTRTAEEDAELRGILRELEGT